MRGVDILGLAAIAVFTFAIGWWVGEYNTISKAKHCEVVQQYASAIDLYRDYTKALEQSVERPNIPSLNLLRENVINNELCDFSVDNSYQRIEPVYRSLH